MEFLASNWIYFIFAVLMIFMMTKGGGCCGGHSGDNNNSHNHGHDELNNRPMNELETVKDPVCGMYVNPDTAIRETIDGKTYYFCSESCRKQFVKSHGTV